MTFHIPPQPDIPQTNIPAPSLPPEVQTSHGEGTASPPRRWRRVLTAILLLVVLVLLLLVIVPAWRARYLAPLFTGITGRLPLPADDVITAQPGAAILAGDGAAASTTPVATFTPTPTPHPAALLDFAIDDGPGRMRWQIAYPDAAHGPGAGCAYLSFWLTGTDAENFALLDDLSAELTILDGGHIFERYGPAPLPRLRGLGDRRYYELPAGEPECRNHRLAEPSDYAGMEFRLSLTAGPSLIRRYRGILMGQDLRFATPTPTPTPAPPTPTPFPQVRVAQTINVRGGPGITYPILGVTQPGDVYPVKAANSQFTWWQIDFLGQEGWVFADLVQAVAVDDIGVAQFIAPSPTPLPTATPVPPTATPTPIPTPYFPFLLVNNGICEPNAAMTYFQGKVLDQAGDPMNGACIHVAYEGPRNTKCSGCDGAPPGEWGFAPFGNLPGKPGTTVRIYVAPCPDDPVPVGGQNPETGFGPLTPVSPVWTLTIGESVQCTGITFQDNRPLPEESQ